MCIFQLAVYGRQRHEMRKMASALTLTAIRVALGEIEVPGQAHSALVQICWTY